MSRESYTREDAENFWPTRRFALRSLAGASVLIASARTQAQSGPAPVSAPVTAPTTASTTASVDGVPIAYKVQGRGDVALVLVHGWACNAGYWREQVAPLAERHTVVTLDLAGHGASGAGRSDWSIARYGDDVAAVIAAVQPKRVVLIGHSMGGPVIVSAAGKMPPGIRLLGLVGVDTWKNVGLPPPPPAVRAAMTEAFTQDFSGAMRRNVSERMFQKTSDPQLVQRIADQMAAADPRVAVAMLGGLFQPDWEAGLARIRVPMVAINADLGGATDDARIKAQAATFRSVTLAGTGHFMMIEAPQRFNAALLAELAMIQGAP